MNVDERGGLIPILTKDGGIAYVTRELAEDMWRAQAYGERIKKHHHETVKTPESEENKG